MTHWRRKYPSDETTIWQCTWQIHRPIHWCLCYHRTSMVPCRPIQCWRW